MKIALLQCDHVVKALQPVHGDVPDLFNNLFERQAPEVSLDVFNVTMGQYPEKISNYDGLISSGSRYSVYENQPWIMQFKEFVRDLYDQGGKFVGICFGHQMIAEALGGRCEKSGRGWGVGIKQVDIYKKMPWMEPELDSYKMIVSHADQVMEIPEEGEIIGGNSHCPCSIYRVGENFLGIQAHPEFTRAFEKDILEVRKDRIGQAVIDEAVLTLTQKTDEAAVTRWIVNFFQNSR